MFKFIKKKENCIEPKDIEDATSFRNNVLIIQFGLDGIGLLERIAAQHRFPSYHKGIISQWYSHTFLELIETGLSPIASSKRPITYFQQKFAENIGGTGLYTSFNHIFVADSKEEKCRLIFQYFESSEPLYKLILLDLDASLVFIAKEFEFYQKEGVFDKTIEPHSVIYTQYSKEKALVDQEINLEINSKKFEDLATSIYNTIKNKKESYKLIKK